MKLRTIYQQWSLLDLTSRGFCLSQVTVYYIRERTKVVRAWKKHKTPLAEEQRIHCNFVKPHEALENQTPTQRAGIEIKARNKWKLEIKASKPWLLYY